MVDAKYFNGILNCKTPLDKQILNDCNPSDSLIQKANFSGYIEQVNSQKFNIGSEWYQGKRDGTTLITENGIPVIKLAFEEGYLHGTSYLFSESRRIAIDFKYGSPTGFVEIEDNGKKIFSGTYKNGRPNGECYCIENNLIYEGNMKDGLPQGHGVLSTKKSQILDGKWENGKCKNRSFSFPMVISFIQSTKEAAAPKKEPSDSVISDLFDLYISYDKSAYAACRAMQSFYFELCCIDNSEYRENYNSVCRLCNSEDYLRNNIDNLTSEIKSLFYNYGDVINAIQKASKKTKQTQQTNTGGSQPPQPPQPPSAQSAQSAQSAPQSKSAKKREKKKARKKQEAQQQKENNKSISQPEEKSTNFPSKKSSPVTTPPPKEEKNPEDFLKSFMSTKVDTQYADDIAIIQTKDDSSESVSDSSSDDSDSDNSDSDDSDSDNNSRARGRLMKEKEKKQIRSDDQDLLKLEERNPPNNKKIKREI